MSYPCGDCGGNCAAGCVFCESCENWFHYKCQNLLKRQFSEISSSKNAFCDYICTKCTKTPEGLFDFGKSLKRLEKYSESGNLEAGAHMEMLFLRNENNHAMNLRKDLSYSASSSLTADRVSNQILENLNISIQGKSPVHVSGDGNCLFNALSVGLTGNEGLSLELRVRTCLELFRNRHAYETAANAKLLLVSPNYEDVCKAAATKGAFSSAWTMVAAATVLGRLSAAERNS